MKIAGGYFIVRFIIACYRCLPDSLSYRPLPLPRQHGVD